MTKTIDLGQQAADASSASNSSLLRRTKLTRDVLASAMLMIKTSTRFGLDLPRKVEMHPVSASWLVS
jgi:hypothetical protein